MFNNRIFEITHFKRKVKKLDRINLALNFGIEFLFSYINNIKNESCIYQLLKPKDVKDKIKVRIGKKGDGGYVLLNDFKNIISKLLIVLEYLVKYLLIKN